MIRGKTTFIILSLLTITGFILHFFNLNWGSPFYFNPDERNIASAVSQLHFPDQMNPHFFAYGSLPIYAIYFISVISNYLSQLLQIGPQTQPFTVTFEEAIIVGRTFSALFATFLIPLIFILGRKLKNENTGIWAAFFATTSVGFIQFSHFGTFEMWLTFLGTVLFLFCLRYLTKPTFITCAFIATVFGALVAVKITALVLLPIPVALFIWHSFQIKKYKISKEQIFMKSDIASFINFLKNIVLFVVIALAIYLITNPFVFTDTKDFLSSMHYESSVALGTLPVFYTDIFLNTIPGIYQFLHVYPFLLNPLVLGFFIPAFIFFIRKMFKEKNAPMLLAVCFFLILLFSQIFLFVKWTRYMVPTLPFIYLFIAVEIPDFLLSIKKVRGITYLVAIACILLNTLFAFSYFKTAFINLDTRIEAVTFAQHAIPLNATILAEPADLGIMPFQDAFPHVDTFNFYELDTNSLDATESLLQQKIASAQFIILPSQRILQSRIQEPLRYPLGNMFYKTLLDGQLGFKKIYETPCDIFCKITYLGDPIYYWEQTAVVFDRPTVLIFKKEG